MVLIDFESTHNFIESMLTTQLSCFPYPIKSFHVVVANGGTISYGGLFHNVKLNMFDYQFSTPMYAIGLGDINVVLSLQWIHTLGTISMNFDVLFLQF
jgi:hypothetical protein